MIFEYGEKVIDSITGYIGVITAYAHYYNKRPDCYLIERIDSTGRPVEWWVDEKRLSKLDEVN